MKVFRRLSTVIVLALLVVACMPLSNGATNKGSNGSPTTPTMCWPWPPDDVGKPYTKIVEHSRYLPIC
jgi:hypothetical protein